MASSGIFLSAAVYAEGEKELYKRSVKIFTQDKIALTVDSNIQYSDGSSEQRSFYLAKYEPEAGNRSLLIRFLEPDDIKCTAVLLNSNVDETKRYAYFPAIKRVRIIPEAEKGKEVFGIGISYEDLGEPQGDFQPLETVEIDNTPTYKLTLKGDGKTQVYFIDKATEAFKQMNVYKNGNLQKEIIIQEQQPFLGESLITRWTISYPDSDRKIDYQVRKSSVGNEFSDNIFHKNKLKRCKAF